MKNFLKLNFKIFENPSPGGVAISNSPRLISTKTNYDSYDVIEKKEGKTNWDKDDEVAVIYHANMSSEEIDQGERSVQNIAKVNLLK
jgi:hypothetical protein